MKKLARSISAYTGIFSNDARRSNPFAYDAGVIPFRFLDLHTEIRVLVYDLFAEPLATEQDDNEDRKEMNKTRLSLFHVCSQVAKEWAPIFYQHKTFVVNVQVPYFYSLRNSWFKVINVPYSNRKIWFRLSQHDRRPWQGHDASARFGRRFLGSLPTNKLQNIRELEYDLDWTQSLPPYYGPRRDPNVARRDFDIEGARSLAKVLNTYASVLTSLERVTVSAHDLRYVHEIDFADTLMEDYLTRWWSLATMKLVINAKHLGKLFEELRVLYQSKETHGILRGWKFERQVWVSVPSGAMEELSTRQGIHGFDVRKVAIVFRKTQIDKFSRFRGQSGGDVSLHAWGPLVGY